MFPMTFTEAYGDECCPKYKHFILSVLILLALKKTTSLL